MGYETYVPLDKNVSFADQIEGDADGPITVVGTYAFANSKSLDEFVAIFSAVAGFMRAQPGFISAQVHRAIGGACLSAGLLIALTSGPRRRRTPPRP